MPSVRARDLRTNIAEMGFDRGVVHTLELLLEERVQEREHMRELTQLVAQCIDQVGNMVQVGASMRDRLDAMKREEQSNDPG